MHRNRRYPTVVSSYSMLISFFGMFAVHLYFFTKKHQNTCCVPYYGIHRKRFLTFLKKQEQFAPFHAVYSRGTCPERSQLRHNSFNSQIQIKPESRFGIYIFCRSITSCPKISSEPIVSGFRVYRAILI